MDPEIAKFKIHDLAAATFVPYNEDGSVNYAGVDAHCRDLAVHGVLVAFSTFFSVEALAVPDSKA